MCPGSVEMSYGAMQTTRHITCAVKASAKPPPRQKGATCITHQANKGVKGSHHLRQVCDLHGLSNVVPDVPASTEECKGLESCRGQGKELEKMQAREQMG